MTIQALIKVYSLDTLVYLINYMKLETSLAVEKVELISVKMIEVR